MQFFKSITSLAAFVAVASAITDQASFFSPGGQVGVCGRIIQNSDLAVALSPANFAGGARCGQSIVFQHNGKSVTASVQDECFTCSGNGVDLTSEAFQVLAPLSDGIISVTYTL
ncbi:RlpA-like double-psi beta-barrel-protein domain-containing protein-containing protein [Mycena vulgaris]|nr:RlpA-like double-psi beta-barrel-protein domain-containing protein-containing protein [Mycena vulgaris]